jgi:hypothetical protein
LSFLFFPFNLFFYFIPGWGLQRPVEFWRNRETQIQI